MTVLSENIAEILRRAKRQQDVAEAVGVEQSTASRWAKGAKPEPERLIALARHVGVSTETLVEVPIDEWPKLDRAAFRRSRERLGWSPARLAQEAHAIILREGSKARINVAAIEAFEAGTGGEDPSWLQFAHMAFEEGPSPKNQVTLPRDELVYVRQVDIRYAMGDGSAPADYPETSLVPFNLGFLHDITHAPLEQLFLATGHGDSMEPTLHKNDLLLIDTTQDRLGQGDLIWALEYAGSGYIKRLRRVKREGVVKVLILSDNPAVPVEEADPDDVHIVGKVTWIGRRMQ